MTHYLATKYTARAVTSPIAKARDPQLELAVLKWLIAKEKAKLALT